MSILDNTQKEVSFDLMLNNYPNSRSEFNFVFTKFILHMCITCLSNYSTQMFEF